MDEASKSISNATRKVSDITNTVTGYFGKSKEEPKPVAFPIKSKLTSVYKSLIN